MKLYLIGQHLGAGLLSLLLVDELHEDTLVLEHVTHGGDDGERACESSREASEACERRGYPSSYRDRCDVPCGGPLRSHGHVICLNTKLTYKFPLM